MLKLYGGSESFQVVASGSSTSVDYYINYTDINKNVVVDSGTGQGNIPSAETITIVPGPATNSYTRQVNYISFLNNDGTNTSTLVIQKVNIETTVNIAITTLQPGWSLRYEDSVGWNVFDANGQVIPYPTITLTGDVTGSGTTTIPTTLATVNPDVGSFGSSTEIPTFTVNAKGLITAASQIALPPSSLTIPFSYGDVSPELIGQVPANRLIYSVEIIITTPFNGTGASLSVGDSSNYSSMMNTSQNLPSAAGTYSSTPSFLYGTDTNAYLSITPGSGATQGSGYTTIRLQD